MKQAKPQQTKATIRFSAELSQPKATGKNGAQGRLTLPTRASVKLPSRGKLTMEATINGFPFRTALEPDGQGSHWFGVNQAMLEAAGTEPGEAVAIEITRVGEEPELRMPADLRQALAATSRAWGMWTEVITPMARRDWILWLSSAKLLETRGIRIKKACSMLSAGKRRVCCFGGLNWLRQNYPTAGDNWLPLPESKNRPLSKSAK